MVTKKYASQLAAQLPVVRLGVGDEWIGRAVDRAVEAVSAETGLPAKATGILRLAVSSVLSDGGPRKLIDRQYGETVRKLGPCRLPESYRGLPAQIAKVAKRLDCTEADVIRSALAEWLVVKGYGKKGKRGSDAAR